MNRQKNMPTTDTAKVHAARTITKPVISALSLCLQEDRLLVWRILCSSICRNSKAEAVKGYISGIF